MRKLTGEKQLFRTEPFIAEETRRLPVRVDPNGQSCQVDAIFVRGARESWGEHRHFFLPQLRASVQLNHGDPADDEIRLTTIAEDLLRPEKSPSEAETKKP